MFFPNNNCSKYRIMSTSPRFSMVNVIKNSINENFKCENVKYKYKDTFCDEFYMSDVYNFCKKDVIHYKNFYNETATFSNYNLYVTHDKETTQIFHLSVDEHDNTLKKEKYFVEEDCLILSPFEIFILIELYELPLSFPQNTIQNVLRPTFELYNEHTSQNPVQVKTLKFKSKTIETGNSTPQEIFNQALLHMINFQCLYKNDHIDDLPATKTEYTLEVVGDYVHRALYHVEINNDGETLHESKPYEVIQSPVVAPYKLELTIRIICYPPEFERERWLGQQAQEAVELLEVRLQRVRQELEEIKAKEDLKSSKKCTKEETCCVCISKPSNVLFPNCGHLCLCEDCNKSLNDNHDFEEGNLKCPMCRTEVTQQRIII